MTATEYDFWVLDLDGTIVDVQWPYVRETFDTLGDRLGRPFSDREATTLWYGLSESRDAYLASLDVDRERFWRVFDDIEDPIRRAEATYLHDDARLLADVEDPCGIVTHCRPRLTNAVLDHLDIRDWFDVVICCNDDLGWKPDPDPVDRAVSQLSHATMSDNGILVGDSPCDIGAAWNAELAAAHVERHSHETRGHCVLADHRIDSFDDLWRSATVAAD